MALISSRISRAVNIDDLCELALRRLPRIVFNYVGRGAEAEWTLRENRRALQMRSTNAIQNINSRCFRNHFCTHLDRC
jgi:isopentenyl diphosphate isomerase/L-lactate dehydrogenase-like FMN-dependent dehydrogenase